MSGHIFKIKPHGEGEEEAKRAKKAKRPAFLPFLLLLPFLLPSALHRFAPTLI
jgi:hypothetical protein